MINPEADGGQPCSALERSIGANDIRREAFMGSTEPLTAEDLANNGMGYYTMSDEYNELVAKIGWPVEADKLPWKFSFPSAADGGDQQFREVGFDNPLNLNNFPAYFRFEPTFTPTGKGGTVELVYATSPMVHRLKLLDPDLFQMLHMTIGAQGGTVNGQTDYIKSFDTERDGEPWNPLIHLMRQAYVTMGRLIAREDKATQYEMMGWGTPGPDDQVQDVSVELAQ